MAGGIKQDSKEIIALYTRSRTMQHSLMMSHPALLSLQSNFTSTAKRFVTQGYLQTCRTIAKIAQPLEIVAPQGSPIGLPEAFDRDLSLMGDAERTL